MFIPASVRSKWRPSSLGVSFQSAMFINMPLTRQSAPPKTANWIEYKCYIMLITFIAWTYGIKLYLHPWNLTQSVKASTNPSPVAFKVAPPFWPNTEGSSVLWNTLKVAWPNAVETNEVNKIMYFIMVAQAIMLPFFNQLRQLRGSRFNWILDKCYLPPSLTLSLLFQQFYWNYLGQI